VDPIERKIEEDLLKRISEGDRAAFGEFYDRYAGILYSVAVRVLNDLKEAEDVTQDVFIAIWQKASGYRPELGSPGAWATTLARNRALDRVRGGQRRSHLAERFALEVKDADTRWVMDAAAKDEEAARIRKALSVLPPEQRQALELAFFAGMSQSEIGGHLGEPLGTIKARIRRGMLRLREELKDIV
jgi:RNA polymerase sigma-70 factor (ECF subfamily)